MLFRMIYDDKLAQAAYLIGCQATGEALIIDPERDVERYIELAARENLRITAVTETHIHADFLSGARELAERTGARLYLSDEGGDDWRYQWLDKKVGGGSYDHQLLRNGDRFRIGNIELEAIHTPGHTPEHLSFLVTDLGGGADAPIGIATGDFVFVGDVGRPDLLETAAGQQGAKEPAARTLYQSLQGFVRLPEYLQVWPAHGAGSACGKALGAIPQSTIGYEKRFNTAMLESQGDEEGFVASILEGQPEPPVYFARMKRENRDGPAVLGGIPVPEHMEAAELARHADQENVVVLDIRSWEEFAAGHLPNAQYAPLNKSFPTVAGAYLEPDQRIYLVTDQENVREAVLNLIRIGLDDVAGYTTPGEMTRFLHAGGRLRTVAEVDAAEMADIYRSESPVILDVRGTSEFEAGHVAGALNVAHTRLAAELAAVPEDRPVYVHCLSGARSAVASSYLSRNRRNVVYINGSYADLVQAGLPIETASEKVTA